MGIPVVISLSKRIKERGGDLVSLPILRNQDAFDPDFKHEFEFSYTGDQIFSNTLVIRNNTTNEIIYQATQVSFKTFHVLPAKSLPNGICYSAEIEVQNKVGVSSGFSKKIAFYCYTSPFWEFTNINENEIIQQSFINATLEYNQDEGEFLNSYQIFLYDSSKNEIYKSGILYQTEVLSTTIGGLRDGYQYFFRAIGITLNGMQLDTGYISASVKYIRPAMYSILLLENNCDDGAIRITSNIRVVTGTSNPTPAKYIENKKVDLTDIGTWVNFEEGFGIERDFSLELIGSNLLEYSKIMELNNKVNSINVFYMMGIFSGEIEKQAYLKLVAHNKLTEYVICSKPFKVPLPSEEISIQIRRINNLYEIKSQYI